MKTRFIIKSCTILSLLLIALSCSKVEPEVEVPPVEPTTGTLELEKSYPINVPEPSGLAINNAGDILYTVSDHTNKVYKLSMTGEVLQSYDYVGDDLEGITVVTDNKLLLAEEKLKEVVEFDISSGKVIKHKINYTEGVGNSGIEGIAFNSSNNTTFILNEKDPGLLFKLKSDFSIEEKYALDFAEDYSGIYYDNSINNLWIVSDVNKTVNRCDLQGKLLAKYDIDVNKPEGVVVTKDKVYVVSDFDSKLYVYKIPTK